MKRGFPRPRAIKYPVTTWQLSVDQREKYDGKNFPVPYSARSETDLAKLHDGRVGECITFCRCIVCGDDVEPDEDGMVMVYRNSVGSLVEDSGPFHEKCAILTQKLCPVIKERGPMGYTWKKESWSDVGPLIRGKHDFSKS